MSDQVKNLDDQPLHYNIRKLGGGGVQFEILRDISENITLLLLMDSVENFNHAVSIFRYWIFESNYKKSLPLTLYSLNLICSLSL